MCQCNDKGIDSKTTELEHQLNTLEQDCQKQLDDKVVAVGSGLLGLAIGFTKSLEAAIQINWFRETLFFISIIGLAITICTSVYSHYDSSITMRKINEMLHYNSNLNFDVVKAIKRIQLFNWLQTWSLMLTILSTSLMLLLITLGINLTITIH